MQKILLIIISALLLLPNFINKQVVPIMAYDHKEMYDPSLLRLNSIAALEGYADSIAAAKQIRTDSYPYLELLEDVIKVRFYHGFSHVSLSENWIAALAGAFIKEDWACKVNPETMMRHGNAACSQQAIIMMQILRNKHFDYRSVGFPHHYAMEIAIDKSWYFFDANMEPNISKQQRMLSAWQHQNDQLKQYYDLNRFDDLDFKFGTGLTATVGTINDVPAKNARLFFAFTGLVSKTAWLLPLLLLGFNLRIDFMRGLPRVAIPGKRIALAGA